MGRASVFVFLRYAGFIEKSSGNSYARKCGMFLSRCGGKFPQQYYYRSSLVEEKIKTRTTTEKRDRRVGMPATTV